MASIDPDDLDPDYPDGYPDGDDDVGDVGEECYACNGDGWIMDGKVSMECPECMGQGWV